MSTASLPQNSSSASGGPFERSHPERRSNMKIKRLSKLAAIPAAVIAVLTAGWVNPGSCEEYEDYDEGGGVITRWHRTVDDGSTAWYSHGGITAKKTCSSC